MARRRRRVFRRRRSPTRRRRAAPRRASRRSRARGVLRRLHPKSAFTQMANVAGGLVFFSQITAKDRAAGLYTGTTGDKLKILVNNVLGRVVGFNAFAAPLPQFQQTINVDGIFNKFAGFGLASLIYGSLPLKMLPHKGKAKTLGKRVLTGAVIGGLFDAPGGSTTSVQTTQLQAPRLIQSTGQQVTTA